MTSAERAADLARFFVMVSAQPYLPDGIRAEAVAKGAGWDVTLHDSHTVPWSPPGPGITIAGSRTAKRTTLIRLDSLPDGEVVLTDVGAHTDSEKTWP